MRSSFGQNGKSGLRGGQVNLPEVRRNQTARNADHDEGVNRNGKRGPPARAACSSLRDCNSNSEPPFSLVGRSARLAAPLAPRKDALVGLRLGGGGGGGLPPSARRVHFARSAGAAEKSKQQIPVVGWLHLRRHRFVGSRHVCGQKVTTSRRQAPICGCRARCVCARQTNAAPASISQRRRSPSGRAACSAGRQRSREERTPAAGLDKLYL